MCSQVSTPPDIPVGLWKFSIECKPKDNPKILPKVFTHADKLYLLFNPWAKRKLTLTETFLAFLIRGTVPCCPELRPQMGFPLQAHPYFLFSLYIFGSLYHSVSIVE
jgi:hypothetical protein